MGGRAAERRARQRAHYVGASAIVTGGASGIGKALASELVCRGATVLVTDIDGRAPRPQASQPTRLRPGSAHGAALDVRDPAAFADVVGRFAADHDGIDFLFNNAGIAISGEVVDLTEAHWQRIIDINLMGVSTACRRPTPCMTGRAAGHIVNTASLSGLLPSPLLVPYSTTKHAVVGLSVGLRVEAASHGVRVSVVCPG